MITMHDQEAKETGIAICGDCRYHMPYATDPRSECRNPVSRYYEREVYTGQTPCATFAPWPEGSKAPLFLSAMRH